MHIVVFHGKCTDGLGSAWVASEYFKSVGITDVQYVAHSHGSSVLPASYFSGADVYFLDICWDPEVMRDIKLAAKSLVVLDHHVSSLNKFSPDDELVQFFDMEKCGTLLTWNYFFKGIPPTPLVLYINDSDLYLFDLDHSREVSAMIHDADFDQPTDELFRTMSDFNNQLSTKSGFKYLVEQGEAKRSVVKEQIAFLLKTAVKIPYKNTHILCINSSMHISEIGNLASKGQPFALVWSQGYDGKFRYSFRSSGAGCEDVSLIAAQFGGGGHKNAAGATSHYAPSHDMFIGF